MRVCVCVCVVTFKMYFLNNFQAYNTGLLISQHLVHQIPRCCLSYKQEFVLFDQYAPFLPPLILFFYHTPFYCKSCFPIYVLCDKSFNQKTFSTIVFENHDLWMRLKEEIQKRKMVYFNISKTMSYHDYRFLFNQMLEPLSKRCFKHVITIAQ